jgi:hypothetical protein
MPQRLKRQKNAGTVRYRDQPNRDDRSWRYERASPTNPNAQLRLETNMVNLLLAAIAKDRNYRSPSPSPIQHG